MGRKSSAREQLPDLPVRVEGLLSPGAVRDAQTFRDLLAGLIEGVVIGAIPSTRINAITELTAQMRDSLLSQPRSSSSAVVLQQLFGLEPRALERSDRADHLLEGDKRVVVPLEFDEKLLEEDAG